MKHIIAFTAIIGLLFFQSCATQGGDASSSTLNLDLSGSWTLVEIHESSGTNIKDGFPEKKPTLTLEAISKKLTGNTGCNQMFGSFQTNQNSVSFSKMGATKMYCANVKEAEYLAMFDKIKTYSILNDQLSFIDAEGKVLLKYSK
jgi:heat shock protein HslJ